MLQRGHAVCTDPENEALARLDRQCFQKPWDLAAFAKLRHNPFVLAWSLADELGQTVAYICFQQVEDEAEIHRIAVLPERRREGWGRLMLECFLETLRKNGGRKAFLDVRAGNISAMQLYLSAGFERVALRRAYYGDPPEDGLVFAWEAGFPQPQ